MHPIRQLLIYNHVWAGYIFIRWTMYEMKLGLDGFDPADVYHKQQLT